MAKYDIALFGASTDKPSKNKTFAEKLSLTFPLLSDTSTDTAKSYGILFRGRARRTTIFVNKEGKIAHIESKIDIRNHGQQIAKRLDTLGVEKK